MAKPATAPSQDTIKFTETILHGKQRFFPGTVIKFEDPATAAFFDQAYNGTEFTTDPPVATVTNEELEIDAATLHDTIIGQGRDGVQPGTTVKDALEGKSASTDGTLEVQDVNLTAGS